VLFELLTSLKFATLAGYSLQERGTAVWLDGRPEQNSCVREEGVLPISDTARRGFWPYRLAVYLTRAGKGPARSELRRMNF
jgi:hypothetical protein